MAATLERRMRQVRRAQDREGGGSFVPTVQRLMPMQKDHESPIRIRHATAEDSILLAELGAETFRDTFGAQNSAEDMSLYLTSSFSRKIQARELSDPTGLFLIAEAGRQPVGYAHLREGAPAAPVQPSRPVEIVRLYARYGWIGRGVGSALMKAALREARSRGHDLIWLDVWEQNTRAIAFYRKWGFLEIGAQPFRLGNDIQRDLLMARTVDDSAAG